MKLEANETKLSGKWILVESQLKADLVTKRIEELIRTYLIYIKTDNSGWAKLYQDPEDLRYWELIYPNSEEQGAGAPVLQNLSIKDAKLKYLL